MRSLIQLSAVALLVLAPSAVRAGEQDGGCEEYAVKAAFLYKLTQYVEWPEGTFKNPGAPVILGVVGASPFGTALEKLHPPGAARAAERGFRIKYYRSIEEMEPCHVLFICPSEAQRAGKILDKVRSSPVLVVGDSPGLAEKGVAINLLIEDNKVCFEVNPDAAKRAHVQISSKVIRLAKAVVQSKPGQD